MSRIDRGTTEALMANLDDQLAGLHTAAIDARNGYREALKEAEGKGLSSLFTELVSLHEKQATELANILLKRGRTPDKDGSFMSLVHEAIMDVRGLFGGLGKSVLPGLIDGEKRNVAKYDEALKEPIEIQVEPVLMRQRSELNAMIGRMSEMKET
jgi:uncharacterized protein (TIGR02284 family)